MLHLGGKTALEIRGASQFLSNKTTQLYLYGIAGKHLPQWFTKRDWEVKVSYLQTSFLPHSFGIHTYKLDDFNFSLSQVERALLEFLYLVPKIHSIEEAYYIVENLSRLNAQLLQQLLENCNSIKVNRLCLYLSEQVGHDWISDLDKSKIKVGSGNRQIVPDGYLEPNHLITIPKSWKNDAPSIF
jgi:hypothetical protein